MDNKEQFGAVIEFKPGTTKEQAEKALKAIQNVLEYIPVIRAYNPEYGSPVFYVP